MMVHLPWARPYCQASMHTPSPSILSRLGGVHPQCHTPSLLPRLRSSPFSTTPSLLKRNRGGPKKDERIRLIRYFLMQPSTPRPLRLSRMRALRHWTIHRAWQLHKSKLRVADELELERQYYEMQKACEQLRLIGTNGLPGGEDEGKLFRVAMEKKGVWQGVPIEYARIQTEWPSRDGWNSGWTRN